MNLQDRQDPSVVQITCIAGELASLGVIEASRHTGFDAKRLYFIHEIAHDHVRGMHAHKTLKQFLICLHGSVRVKLENRNGCFVFELGSASKGICNTRLSRCAEVDGENVTKPAPIACKRIAGSGKSSSLVKPPVGGLILIFSAISDVRSSAADN